MAPCQKKLISCPAYVRLSKITMRKYADFGLQFSFNHQLNMKGHTASEVVMTKFKSTDSIQNY